MPRPKAFVPEQVLDRAISLFQAKGFVGTSVDDLVTGMGISRASMYDTFGSKDELFHAALERYLVVESQAQRTACAPARSAAEFFRRLFDHMLAQHRGSALPTGCLLVNAANERWHLATGTQARLNEVLETNRNVFRQVLLEGKQRGEAIGDVDRLSWALLGTILTLRTMSRAGLPEEALRQVADHALRSLHI